jgi:hypothetical protein
MIPRIFYAEMLLSSMLEKQSEDPTDTMEPSCGDIFVVVSLFNVNYSLQHKCSSVHIRLVLDLALIVLGCFKVGYVYDWQNGVSRKICWLLYEDDLFVSSFI